MECVGADSAAMKLTYKIIGHQTDDLLDILRQFAADIGVDHIAYVRMGSNKSLEFKPFGVLCDISEGVAATLFPQAILFDGSNITIWNEYVAKSFRLGRCRRGKSDYKRFFFGRRSTQGGQQRNFGSCTKP